MNYIEEHQALIAELAHNLYRKTHLYDFEDLFQIGLQSAVRLERVFDPSKAKRSTFYTKCITRDMIKFIKKHKKLFANVPHYTETPTHPTIEAWESLPDLCPEDEEMVRMLAAGHSKREIAKRLQLTVGEVQTRLNLIGESIV